MRIGDGGSSPASLPHYQTPAEELHAATLEAIDQASLLTQMALGDALKDRTPWDRLPQSVRDVFEGVVEAMGISDP
jgi:hypothetical protein